MSANTCCSLYIIFYVVFTTLLFCLCNYLKTEIDLNFNTNMQNVLLSDNWLLSLSCPYTPENDHLNPLKGGRLHSRGALTKPCSQSQRNERSGGLYRVLVNTVWQHSSGLTNKKVRSLIPSLYIVCMFSLFLLHFPPIVQRHAVRLITVLYKQENDAILADRSFKLCLCHTNTRQN